MSSVHGVESALYRLGPVRRLVHWLDAMSHPPVVCEIATTHVAAARWGRAGMGLDSFAVEPLAEGTLIPSPIDPNLANAGAVQTALRRVFNHVSGPGQDLALLVPDPVVRVFILPFDTFPRRLEEAVPMLRWRLKKSVPFDVDETVVSSMRQTGKDGGLEVVAALARQRIVREYETLVEAVGMTPGVVLSSSLATLPLLEEADATLLVRMSGSNLTTVIVHGANLCVYRSTDMSVDAAMLDPKAMLDEIFPAVAYYQDTWGGSIARARLAGLGEREEVFQRAVRDELGCAVLPLASAGEGLPDRVQSLLDQRLEALVGWAMNRGA